MVSDESKQLFGNKRNLKNQELKNKYRNLLNSELDYYQTYFTEMIRNIIEQKKKEQEKKRIQSVIDDRVSKLFEIKRIEPSNSQENELDSRVNLEEDEQIEKLQDLNDQDLDQKIREIVQEIVQSEIITTNNVNKFIVEKKERRKGWFRMYFLVNVSLLITMNISFRKFHQWCRRYVEMEGQKLCPRSSC